MDLLLATINSDVNLSRKILATPGRSDSVNYRDNSGYTALMHASSKGDLELVKLLLEHKSNVDDISNDGWNAFLISCREGHLSIAKLLYSDDANIQDKQGWTGLMFSCAFGYLDIAQFLVSTKNANVKNNEGYTSFHWACAYSAYRYSKCISKACHGCNQCAGNVSLVKALIPFSDITSTSNDGINALIVASKKGNFLVVEHLLTTKYFQNSINNVDQKGNTALYSACFSLRGTHEALLNRNLHKVIRLLLLHGANIDIRNNCNDTIYSFTHMFTQETKLLFENTIKWNRRKHFILMLSENGYLAEMNEQEKDFLKYVKIFGNIDLLCKICIYL